MAVPQELGRSPTFVVGGAEQRGTLDILVRREQHFSEQYSKNKPLCFNAKPFQKTHPKKASKQRELGQRDADATLISPMMVAIADGVSQIEEFGIDASELPNELLNALEEQAIAQLLPGQETEEYMGPISMMREAYDSTTCLGSTTVLSATMDNSTRIHGKLHPMIAICSIGDCEIVVLRRNPEGVLALAFHTEMQRIDGNAQSPLQLARVDETIDPNFDPEIMSEVIERGSAVHCVSAYEGDVVILGTDGVFDNLFVSEVVEICNEMLYQAPGQKFRPLDRNLLGEVARRVVLECHSKTQPGVTGGYRDCPIGKGGKVDDTSCIIGEVVEWTEAHGEAWSNLRTRKWFRDFFTCGGSLPTGSDDTELVIDDRLEYENGARVRRFPQKPNASFSTYWGSFDSGSFNSFNSFTSGYGRPGDRAFAQYGARPMEDVVQERRNRRYEEDEEEERTCSIM